MEWLITVFVTLLIVLLVGALFAAAGARGPWSSMLWFFLILFAGTLAIGAWVEPVGPRVWGVPWLTLLIGALFIGFLIAAATPDDRRRYRHMKELPLQRDAGTDVGTESTEENPSEMGGGSVAATTAVGIFFWIFLVVAGSLLLLRLLFQSLA